MRQMPYDRSAVPPLAALTLTVHVTEMMMDTMKGLDIAGMMTHESVTDHGEPDMNPGIRVLVVGGKEIAPARVPNEPDTVRDLR